MIYYYCLILSDRMRYYLHRAEITGTVCTYVNGAYQYGEIMKEIKVAAAVICGTKGGKKAVFSTARGYGAYKGKWEFPGGKIEAGETPEEALDREIREEIDVGIEVGELIDTVEYDYPDFHLTMFCYICSITDGEIVLREASDAEWLTTDRLYSVDWLPADMGIIEKIRSRL